MLISLLTALVERFRGRGIRGNKVPARQPVRRAAFRLEELEDRCLLSVTTTTVPAFTDIPTIVAIPDVLMTMQPRGNPTIAFVGDSIGFEYGYGTGAGIWSAVMAPLGAANYSMSGQTTQSLLFQFSLGQLLGIHPGEVVLSIGGNNLLQGDSPQDTAEGVLADVATIHQFLPQSNVIVMGILPGMQSPTAPYRAEGEQTNALVSQMLAGDPQATFVDLGWIFLQPDGTISDTMMFDYLHPTTLGYLDYTVALFPVLQANFPGFAPSPAPSTHSLIQSG